MKTTHYHQYATADLGAVLAALNSRQEGLSTAEAAHRLVSHGGNELPTPAPRGLLTVFGAQFSNLLVWLLVGAAAVSALLTRWPDAVFITFALLLNAVIGAVQEYRAGRILADLSSLVQPQARVRREGQERYLPARQVVPGDILIIEAGYRVAADARLILTHDLAVNESTLTGESQPAVKGVAADTTPKPLTKTDNCVFCGTVASRGRGEAVVFATGQQTELGRIARELVTVKPPSTPLHQQIRRFSRQALIVVSAVIVGLFLLGLLAGQPAGTMFITAVTLAVAAIPEGLPILITVVLVFGIRRLATRRVLVQQLAAVETLGQVNILIVDKTGTLTTNQLTVSAVCLPARRGFTNTAINDLSPFTIGLGPVLRALLLANDASDHSLKNSVGDDPVDAALRRFASPRLVHWSAHRYPRVFAIPFSSELKLMATFHRKSSVNTQVYVKGSVTAVLALCATVARPAGERTLTDRQRQSFLQSVHAQSASGAKLIVTAETTVRSAELERTGWQPRALLRLLSGRLTLTGAAALSDPLRATAAATIRQAQRAGIRVVMATGDSRQVAATIGQQLGLSGQPITAWPSNRRDLFNCLQSSDIFAEVTPTMKLEMVTCWQRHGQVVAMAGDGVNDAPALTKADVGLAMGRRGTDIARDTADIVMLDDNIATVVTAIAAGRTTFRNTQKVMAYLLATNLAEVLVVLLATIAGSWLPLPLLPTQILWINLITDGLTVVPLALEPDHEDVMHQPPRRRTDPLFSSLFLTNIYLVAGLTTLITLIVFTITWVLTQNTTVSRTVAFVALGLAQAFNLLNARSVKSSFFTLGVTTNPAVLISLVGTVALQIIIIYLPLTSHYLSLAPLSFGTIVGLLGLSSLVFWLLELSKWWRRRLSTAVVV